MENPGVVPGTSPHAKWALYSPFPGTMLGKWYLCDLHLNICHRDALSFSFPPSVLARPLVFCNHIYYSREDQVERKLRIRHKSDTIDQLWKFHKTTCQCLILWVGEFHVIQLYGLEVNWTKMWASHACFKLFKLNKNRRSGVTRLLL